MESQDRGSRIEDGCLLMAFLHSFTAGDFLDSMVSLLAAVVLGALIGKSDNTGSEEEEDCARTSLFQSAPQLSSRSGSTSTATRVGFLGGRRHHEAGQQCLGTKYSSDAVVLRRRGSVRGS